MKKIFYLLSLSLFLINTANSQTLNWAVKYGNDSTMSVQDMAKDASGNLYIVGYFKGANLDFDPGAGTALKSSSSNSEDGYLVKLNSSGAYQWVVTFGGTGNERVFGVDVTAGGNVLIGGYLNSTTVDMDPSAASFNLTTGLGRFSGFGAMYSTAGSFLWAMNAGGTLGNTAVYDIKSDASSNIYVAGTNSDTTADFDPSATVVKPISYKNGSLDAFIVKYNSLGTYQWQNAVIGDGTEIANTISVDNVGNVFMNCPFASDTVFFSMNGTVYQLLNNDATSATQDNILCKFNTTTGVMTTALPLGGDDDDFVNKIGIDNANNVYLVGSYYSTTIDLGGSTNASIVTNSNTSKAFTDAFISKYDNNLSLSKWAYSTGVSTSDESIDNCFIDLSTSPNSVFVTGNYLNAFDIDLKAGVTTAANLSASGSTFYAKYDTSATLLKHMEYGGNSFTQNIIGINNTMYVSGIFGGTVDYNPSPTITQNLVSSNNSIDGFVAKYIFCGAPATGSFSTSICQGQSYLFNGINRTTSGAYLDTLLTSQGCDSILTLNLTVTPNPVPAVSIAASSNPICAGQSVTFTATPTNGGNAPTYVWRVNSSTVSTSGATYSSSSLVNGDVVSCTLTSNATCASPTTASSNDILMTINPLLVPSVSIAASNNPACAGQSVTFTATPTNGGTTPTYVWKVNNTTVSTSGATYSSSSLVNGDVVSCVMTSNATCKTTATATSNNITMTVNASLISSVSIAASSNPICAGTSVTFTATPTNGGTTPTYVWKVNNTTVSTSGATYSSSSLVNGDVVSCTLTSSATCASPTTASSNNVTMTVNPLLVPSVSIAASSNPICAGQSVTFTATPTNGGTTPTYVWKVNNTTVSTSGATYSSSSLVNGDVVSCTLTSNATCASPTTASSNNVTMTVNPLLVPSVSIAASSNPICTGQSVTFTATPTNGGTTPTYVWKVNNTTVSTSGATYSSSSLVNGDVVSCVMTSNATCKTTATATSNNISISVTSPYAPTVSIAASANPVCTATSVTFTATPTNGGTAPTYQWKVNGNNVGTGGTSYSSNSLVNSDVVSCVMTSNSTCASTPTATSNNVTMNITTPATPTVSISTATTTVCTGANVTFTATPTNGGTTPTYQWKMNGSNVGSGGASYNSNSLVNGDVVSCLMTSNATCITTNTANSNSINMIVNPVVAPAVSISTPAVAVCIGQGVTILATPTNGGTTPSYTWRKNGVIQSGNTDAFTFNPINGDYVTCTLTSNAACLSTTTANSNTLTFSIVSSVTPSINISTPNTSICAGTNVTYTANAGNGGTAPTYQWKLNGNNVGSGGNTYSSNTLANGDIISCILTSNSSCATTPNATSNNITMTVNQNLAPSVSLSTSSTSICAGQSVTYTATPTNGGTTPAYQWKVNGTNITNSGATYTSNSIQTSDVVSCVLTSNYACATTTTATSNNISITVNPVLTPNIGVTPTSTSICAGQSVTFTATPVNGGTNPTYQWYVGTVPQPSTSSSFTTSSLVNGAVVTCNMVSNATCASPASVTSSPVNMTVKAKPAKPIILAGTTLNTLECNQLADQYTWIYNNINTLAANTKIISPAANGGYTVVVTTNGCSSDTSAVYSYTRSGVQSVEQVNIHITPNPTIGKIYIDFTQGTQSEEIKLYDILGNEVTRDITLTKVSSTQQVLDIEKLASANYFVVVKVNNISYYKQITLAK